MAHGDIEFQSLGAQTATLLDAAAATTDGVWIDVGEYENASVHFDFATGTGVGTVQFRGSDLPTKPDNTAHGVQIGTDQTASSLSSTLTLPRWVKCRVTAFTSGTISVYCHARKGNGGL